MNNKLSWECAGFIVFRHYEKNLEVLLSQDKKKQYPIDFPKGRLELDGTYFEAACRNFMKETGISASDIWVQGSYVTESCNFDTTRYYVAIARFGDPSYSQDLSYNCGWKKVQDVEKINWRREQILSERLALMKQAENIVRYHSGQFYPTAEMRFIEGPVHIME